MPALFIYRRDHRARGYTGGYRGNYATKGGVYSCTTAVVHRRTRPVDLFEDLELDLTDKTVDL